MPPSDIRTAIVDQAPGLADAQLPFGSWLCITGTLITGGVVALYPVIRAARVAPAETLAATASGSDRNRQRAIDEFRGPTLNPME
jgi:hypothetical protein